MSIEELKKEAISKINSCIDCYADEPDGYINTFIDQAVSIATKEAVEAERQRIIGVIDAGIKYYYDKSERFGVKYRLISNALESIKKSILSTPQSAEGEIIDQDDKFKTLKFNTIDGLKNYLDRKSTPQPESVPDTMLASEDTLKKDWGNPAEDEVWKGLTPDPNDKLKVRGTQNFPSQQEHCEWTVDRKEEDYVSSCGERISILFYGGMNDFNFCPYCNKPIKIKEV